MEEIEKEASTQYNDFKGTMACEDIAAIGVMAKRAGMPESHVPIGFRAYKSESRDEFRVVVYAVSGTHGIDGARRRLIEEASVEVDRFDASFTGEEFLRLFRRLCVVGWSRGVHDVVVGRQMMASDRDEAE